MTVSAEIFCFSFFTNVCKNMNDEFIFALNTFLLLHEWYVQEVYVHSVEKGGIDFHYVVC